MKKITIRIDKKSLLSGDTLSVRIETSDSEGRDIIDSLVQLKADKVSVFIDGNLPNALDPDAPASVWQDSPLTEAQPQDS